MGKSIIDGNFSIAMLVYQRVYIFIPYHILCITFHDIPMETSMMSYVIHVHSVFIRYIYTSIYLYPYNIAAYEVKYTIFIYIHFFVYIFHDLR